MAAPILALHLFTIGSNDVRELVTATGRIVDRSSAQATLQKAANELIEEVRQVIEHGAKHVVVTGVPDIGTIPYYNGLADEGARRAAATEYSTMLDTMIRSQLNKLPINGVNFKYISLTAATQDIIGDLTTAGLYDSSIPLSRSGLFFDAVHPTAQAHGLLAASLLDTMGGTLAGDVAPLTNADFALRGTISVTGEVDTLVFSLAANTTYSFEMLGISSGRPQGLESWQVLADPAVRLLGPDGVLIAANDDGGLGLDARLQLTTSQAGSYTLELRGVGSLMGSYLVQAENHSGSIIGGSAGGIGMLAGFSYTPAAGPEVQVASAERRTAEFVATAAAVTGLLLASGSAHTAVADVRAAASEPRALEPPAAETLATLPTTSATAVPASALLGEAPDLLRSDQPSRLLPLAEQAAPANLAETIEHDRPFPLVSASPEPLASLFADALPLGGHNVDLSQLMAALLQAVTAGHGETKTLAWGVATAREAFVDAGADGAADVIVDHFAGADSSKPAAAAAAVSLQSVLSANVSGNADFALLPDEPFQLDDVHLLAVV